MIAPISVIGLYEVSRMLEKGQPVSLRNAFNLFGYKSFRTIVVLSLVLGTIWITWLLSAYALYAHFMGDYVPTSFQDFFEKILYTNAGQSLMIIGSAVGFMFSLVIFWVSVISFPMIIDRDVTAVEAIATSVRVVLRNPLDNDGVGAHNREFDGGCRNPGIVWSGSCAAHIGACDMASYTGVLVV